MKTLRLKCIVGILLGTTLSGYTALGGEFINLGFDQLNWPNSPSPIPGPPIDFTFGNWIRPGWNSTPQSAVGYNYTQHFWNMASIVDRDYRNTQYGQNISAPVVGRFSLVVWPFSRPVNSPNVYTRRSLLPQVHPSLSKVYLGNRRRWDQLPSCFVNKNKIKKNKKIRRTYLW